MISRRDALRLAAAVTAATPLASFAISPERAAAHQIERAAQLGISARRWT